MRSIQFTTDAVPTNIIRKLASAISPSNKRFVEFGQRLPKLTQLQKDRHQKQKTKHEEQTKAKLLTQDMNVMRMLLPPNRKRKYAATQSQNKRKAPFVGLANGPQYSIKQIEDSVKRIKTMIYTQRHQQLYSKELFKYLATHPRSLIKKAQQKLKKLIKQTNITFDL